MPSELLEAITIETGANPDASVIWMHGLGDDGKGWSEVVPALNLPQSLAVRFIFPHAPVIAVTINNGMRMRAWYDIRQANLSERADLDGVRTSQAHVDALIAREAYARYRAAARDPGAGSRRAGRSRCTRASLCASAWAASSACRRTWSACDRVVAEASAANRDVPIFMAHGTLRSGRAAGVGRAIARRAAARVAGPSSGTCIRSSTRRSSRRSSPSAGLSYKVLNKQ